MIFTAGFTKKTPENGIELNLNTTDNVGNTAIEN